MERTNDEIVVLSNREIYGYVYKITNKINKKVYIGVTNRSFDKRYCYRGIGIERVYKFHKQRKINGFSYNKHLLRSIEKYGFDAFEIVKEYDLAFSEEELKNKEIDYINKYDSFHNGYNQTLGGDGTSGFIKPKLEINIEGLVEEKEKRIIFDTNITPVEFRVYSFIRLLNDFDIYCITLDYIANEVGISNATVKRSVSNMIKKGYITRRKMELSNFYNYEAI